MNIAGIKFTLIIVGFVFAFLCSLLYCLRLFFWSLFVEEVVMVVVMLFFLLWIWRYFFNGFVVCVTI